MNFWAKFSVSIYPEMNKRLDNIVNLYWRAGNSNTSKIAVKYQINPDACFLAIVNNSSLIGVGYT